MTRRVTSRLWMLGGLAALGLTAVGMPAVLWGAGQAGDASLRIVTLSAARPHLVSGGDVLVRVEADETVRLTDLVVLLDDVDVTRSFRPDPGRHAILGLVRGLADGDHTLAFPTARHVAGAPLANNVVKCVLKPITPDDYAVTFTTAERARLERIFPDGVCDWSQPGMYSGDLRGTWLSFGPSPVNRVR